MRLKRSRIRTFYLRKREVKRDSEGGTYEEFSEALSFRGEAWPAGGKAQAEQYGERLAYIYNLRLDGSYKKVIDSEGRSHYVYPDGLDVMERDGICLDVSGNMPPDYQILSIKPYRYLRLEVEKV